jgi:hypothetical protein
MKAHIVAIAAIAGSLFLTPAMMNAASAGGHGGGMGGMGGMSHISGMGGMSHISGMGGMGQFRSGSIGGTHIASMGGWNGSRWHGGSAWHGNNWHGNNMHDHDHNHFAHNDHRHFNNRFVGVGIGWWPGYAYGYGGCGWLYRNAVATGSPYWWNRYYACANYNYY